MYVRSDNKKIKYNEIRLQQAWLVITDTGIRDKADTTWYSSPKLSVFFSDRPHTRSDCLTFKYGISTRLLALSKFVNCVMVSRWRQNGVMFLSGQSSAGTAARSPISSKHVVGQWTGAMAVTHRHSARTVVVILSTLLLAWLALAWTRTLLFRLVVDLSYNKCCTSSCTTNPRKIYSKFTTRSTTNLPINNHVPATKVRHLYMSRWMS